MRKLIFFVAGCVLVLGAASCAPTSSGRTGGFSWLTPKLAQHIIGPSQVRIVKDERFNASERENQLIERSIAQLRERAVQLLDCSYAEDNFTQHFYFWYQAVIFPQSGFAKISPAHPLGGLGDRSISNCPPSLADARALQRNAIAEFELLAEQRLRYLQTPLAEVAGRPNENQCLYTEVNTWGALYTNRCEYSLNMVWEVGNPSGLSSGGWQRASIAARQTFRAVPFREKYMAALACRSPALPVLRGVSVGGAIKNYSPGFWHCERPADS
jgi:hypothetical protein